MTLARAIVALQRFAIRHGKNPQPGDTTVSIADTFEERLFVEWDHNGNPIWAWINATDHRNSCGV